MRFFHSLKPTFSGGKIRLRRAAGLEYRGGCARVQINTAALYVLKLRYRILYDRIVVFRKRKSAERMRRHLSEKTKVFL